MNSDENFRRSIWAHQSGTSLETFDNIYSFLDIYQPQNVALHTVVSIARGHHAAIGYLLPRRLRMSLGNDSAVVARYASESGDTLKK